MPHHRLQQDHRHTYCADCKAHIKKQELDLTHLRPGIPQRKQVPNNQQDPQFRRAKAPVRQVKRAKRLRRQVNLNRQPEIGDQESVRYTRRHVARKCQPRNEKEGANGVQNMVCIEAVSGPLLIPDSSQRPVQRIPKPVDNQARNHPKQRLRVAAGDVVAQTCCHLGDKSQPRQVVGIHPSRKSGSRPDQQFLFSGGQQTGVRSIGLLELFVRHGGFLSCEECMKKA